MFDVKLHTWSYKGHKGLYLYVMTLFSTQLQIVADTTSRHPSSVMSSSLDFGHRSSSPPGAFLQNSSHVEGIKNDLRPSDGRLKRKYRDLDTYDTLIEKWDNGSAVIPVMLTNDHAYDTDWMTNDTIDIDVSSPDDGGISSNWFNVTDAALRGIEAQHEYCGAYCNGTDKIPQKNSFTTRPSCLTCYCDVSCGKYGDCCPRLEATESHVTEMHAVKDTCISVCHRGVVQVVKSVCSCPTQNSSAGHDCTGTNTSDTVSDIATRQPVLSADLSILYCNAACAYCNGESEIVQLSSRCQVNPLDDAFLEDSSESGSGSLATDEHSGCSSWCQNAWQVPQNYTPRQCFDSIDLFVFKGFRYVSTCNSTDDDRIVDLCGSYRFPVIFDDVVYSNLFCAICNGILPMRVFGARGLRGSFPRSGILIRFQQQQHQFKTVEDPEKCTPGKWYDVAKDVCRSVHCKQTRTLVTEWLCDFPDKTTGTDLYSLGLRLTPLNNKTAIYAKLHWHKVRGQFVQFIGKLLQSHGALSYAIRTDEYVYGDASVFFVIGEIENRTKMELDIIRMFTKEEVVLRTDDGSLEFKGHFQDYVEPLYGENVSISFGNGSCCDAAVGDAWLDDITSSRLNYRHIELGLTTPLAFVLLDEKEYELLDNVVHLRYINVTLDRRYVENSREGLEVPIIHLQTAYEAHGFGGTPQTVEGDSASSVAEDIVSSCCLYISIVCLVFVLLTYGKFAQLRTLPGLNNTFLAAWLLVGQVLLVSVPSRTELPALCVVLGALLHGAWLCVVCWSSVCSFHMFYIFVLLQSSLTAQRHPAWYLKRYAVFAQLLPVLIVTCVVSASQVSSHGREYGYGGHICYLNSVLLVGVGFVLPLSLAVTFNLVMLGLTALALSRVERIRNSNHSTVAERSNIAVYVKLSSLTGMCWIVALLAEIPGCEWLRFPSAVLNGLQGLHLAVSYTFNRRVFNLWRRAIKRPETKTEVSSNKQIEGKTSSDISSSKTQTTSDSVV